jgi:hypothetical protein
MNVAGEYDGAFTFVEEGPTYAGTGWTSLYNEGTSAITWTQFSSAGSYVGGSGLTLTGLTFDVNVDNSTIEVASDALRVKDAGITAAKLAVSAVDLSTTKVTGTLPVTKGGTGSTTAAAARAALSALGKTAGVASPALSQGVWTAVTTGLGVTCLGVLAAATISGTAYPVEIDWRINAANPTTQVDVKVDVVGGRAAAYYNLFFFG